MIEQVARVLCARCGVDPDGMSGGTWDGGSYRRGEPAWKTWADDARAAIQAMREPTHSMTRAGINFALSANIGGDYKWPDYIADLHREMITAALSED